MKLKILGTGTSQGVPIIGCNCEVCTSSDPKDKRLRTAAQITSETSRILIDIGPDFRQQMLAMKSASAIDGILITHEHSDHTTGIDDIRPFNKFSPHSIPIFAEVPVIKDLKLRYRYIFSDHPYPGGPRLELKPVDVGQSFTVGDIVVKTFRVWHGTLGILGFQFDKCAYITDASRLDEGVIDSLKGISVLVINALRYQPHPTHFSVEECLQIIQRIQPLKAVIVHISHQMGRHQSVNQTLPNGVELAWDGMEIDIL